MQNNLILPDIAVLQSINPPHCENIASLIKTIEVRKSKPKLEVPFKVYIYCTKQKQRFSIGKHTYAFADNLYIANGMIKCGNGFEDVSVNTTSLNGKVIGEYVCDRIDTLLFSDTIAKWKTAEKESCLTEEQLREYSGLYEKPLYLHHISNLVIYDKPKELSKFKKVNRDCFYNDLGLTIPNCDKCNEPSCFIQRPPQSWCYVQAL